MGTPKRPPQQGWPEQQRWWRSVEARRLYWGNSDTWPPPAVTFHDSESAPGEQRADVRIPSVVTDVARVQPMLRFVPDEPARLRMFERFTGFWRWWIEGGREATRRGDKTNIAGIDRAPLMKVIPPKMPKRSKRDGA